jgi:hypothetical protein
VAVSSTASARLLERLLADPGFRARFRENPAEAAREAGFDELAGELDSDGGEPFETLELRESRSSVAGVMLAAAVEGLGLFELSEHVLPHLGAEDALAADTPPSQAPPADDAPASPAVQGREPADDVESDAPAIDTPASDQPTTDDQEAAEPASDGDGEEEPDEDEPDEDEPDEDEPDDEEPDDVEPDQDPANDVEPDDADGSGDEPDDADGSGDEPDDADGSGDEPDDGSDGDHLEGDDGSNGGRDGSNDGGDGSDDGDGDSSDPDDDGGAGGGSSEAAPRLGGAWKPDPEQYGMAGGGGPRSPIDAAVLRNSHLTLDANGKQDFAKGRMDPRLGTILLRLAENHRITLSATTSDHPQNTAGGSPSNHWYGRAVDIATVDGEIVRPNSAAGRRLATELTRIDPSIRPDEIGSPWAITAPGFFTDGDHQDHIHVAFDEAIGREWRPPNDARVMAALRPDQVDGRSP